MSTQSSKHQQQQQATACHFERGNAGFSPATKRSNEDLFIRKVHFRPDDSNDFYEEEEEEEEELDCNTIDIGEEEEDDDDELEVTVTKFDFLISQQQQQPQSPPPPMKSSSGGVGGELSADLSLVSNAYSPGGSSSSFSSYSTPALAALSLYINSTTATTSHLQITNTTGQLDCENTTIANQIESTTTELSCQAKSNRQHRHRRHQQHSSVSSESSSSLSPTTTSEHSTGSPVTLSPSSSSLGTPPLLNKLDAIEAHLNESASYLNIFSPIPENEPAESTNDLTTDKQQDFEAQRSEHLFTPDSLESSCSISSSLSDLSAKLLPNNQQEEEEDDQHYFESSPQQQATQLSAQSIEEDLKADAEICQINHESTGGGDVPPLVTKPASETSLILDKIKRINQLQEKINDINNKIKSIDMSSHSAIGNSTQARLIGSGINPSYYCLQKHEPYEEEEEEEEMDEVVKQQATSTIELTDEDSIRHFVNPKYCGDDDEEEDEDEDEALSREDPRQAEYNQHKQDYRSLHNQTRMCIRKQGFQEANQKIFENLNHNLVYGGNSSGCRRLEDEDDDEEEEEDDNEDEEEHLKYIKNCYTNEFGEHDYIEYRHGKLVDEDDRVGDELDDDEDDESFEDDDEDEDMFHNGGYVGGGGGVYKQAQPVHKKYASTGFLFHRFGGYLAPIEECQEEPPATYEPAFNFKSFVSCYSLIEPTKCANSSYSPASLVNKAGTSTNQFSSHIEASQCADARSPPYPGHDESWKGEFCS